MTYRRDTSGLVDGTQQSGVYRVIAPGNRIAPLLRDAGWSVGELGVINSKADFYAEIGHALAFPGYFGSNLDALWDSLTDLTSPTALIIGHWAHFATADPEQWRRIYGVLTERTGQTPSFAVVLAEPDRSDRT